MFNMHDYSGMQLKPPISFLTQIPLPKKAAAYIADLARLSVAKHERFLLAVSGGKTPTKMSGD